MCVLLNMEETETQEIKEETPEVKEAVEDVKDNSPILERAEEANKKKEELLLREEKLIARKEKLQAEEMVGGRTTAGQMPPKPEEETPEEKAARFERGELDLLAR